MASSCLHHTLLSHNRQDLGGQRRSWLEDEIPLALCHTLVSTRTPCRCVDASTHELASLSVPGIREAEYEYFVASADQTLQSRYCADHVLQLSFERG